jgi:hypothetical protein
MEIDMVQIPSWFRSMNLSQDISLFAFSDPTSHSRNVINLRNPLGLVRSDVALSRRTYPWNQSCCRVSIQ